MGEKSYYADFFNFPIVLAKQNAEKIALVEERLAAWQKAVPIKVWEKKAANCLQLSLQVR